MSYKLGKNPKIRAASGRFSVDGRHLRADVLPISSSERIPVSSSQLADLLVMGRLAIGDSIENLYTFIHTENPGLLMPRPPVMIAQLGTQEQMEGPHSQVFTEAGLASSGVVVSPVEIHERFRGHWDAVTNAGFMPEALKVTLGRDAGAWLALRKPTVDQVAYHWLLHREDAELADTRQELEAITKGNEVLGPEEKAAGVRYVRLYRAVGEKAVEAFSDTYGDSLRSRKQIGLELTLAALKASINGPEGFEADIQDVLMYAQNDNEIDDGTVRAIENSTY